MVHPMFLAHLTQHGPTEFEVGVLRVERRHRRTRPDHERVTGIEGEFHGMLGAVLDERDRHLADGDLDVLDVVDGETRERCEAARGETDDP
jgi:hypothetical protein